VCGIAGTLRWGADVDPADLSQRTAAMVDALAHCGPNDQGIEAHGRGIVPPEPAIEPSTDDENLLTTLQRYDLEHSLAEGLLTKADRAGMFSAIELRAPFLNPGVLDFAARLSPRNGCAGSPPRSSSRTTPDATCRKPSSTE
jgi:asparagine synthetase B (glutamine-hydrolysing)